MLACNSNIYFLLYIRLSSMTFKFTYEKSHYTYGELWKHEKVVGVVEVVVGVESKVRVARTLNLLHSKNTIFFSGSSNFKAKIGGGGWVVVVMVTIPLGLRFFVVGHTMGSKLFRELHRHWNTLWSWHQIWRLMASYIHHIETSILEITARILAFFQCHQQHALL